MNIFDLKDCLEEDVRIDFNGQPITIKKRVDMTTKLYIADRIKKLYFTESYINTEVTFKDFKNILYICFVLSNYTDIDLGEGTDFLEIADIAILSGLWDKVISCIPLNERAMLKEMIDDAIAEEYRKRREENSIENQLSKFIQWIQEKAPSKEEIEGLLAKLPDMINKIEPNKLQFVQDAIKATKMS